jgi:hypothetical protein
MAGSVSKSVSKDGMRALRSATIAARMSSKESCSMTVGAGSNERSSESETASTGPCS